MDLLVGAIPEWLALVSIAWCSGVLVCSVWVLRPSSADSPFGQDPLHGPMERSLRLATAVLFASSVLELLARSAELSGRGFAGALPVLPTLLLRTHLGHTWMVRMGALAALAVTVAASQRSRHPGSFSCVMLGCTALVSAMSTASGHPANMGDFTVAEVLDWLHLLAAMVWGGGLLVLSFVILPRLATTGDLAAPRVARASARFSRLAGIAAGIIVLTAPYQAWAYGGSIELLIETRYGQIVVAKTALLLVLLVLGAFNRYLGVPRLQEWAGFPMRRGAIGRVLASMLRPLAPDAPGALAAARFTRAIRLEGVLLIAVLLCAAMLRRGDPARHEDSAARHQAHGSSSTAASGKPPPPNRTDAPR